MIMPVFKVNFFHALFFTHFSYPLTRHLLCKKILANQRLLCKYRSFILRLLFPFYNRKTEKLAKCNKVHKKTDKKITFLSAFSQNIYFFRLIFFPLLGSLHFVGVQISIFSYVQLKAS